jgi:hypothetical protein
MNFSEHIVTACESEVPDFHSDNIVLSPGVLRCSSSLRDVIGLTCHGLAGQLAEAATQLTVSLVMSFMVKLIRECEQTLWFSVWSSNFNVRYSCFFASRVPIRMSVSENLPETACYKNDFPRRVTYLASFERDHRVRQRDRAKGSEQPLPAEPDCKKILKPTRTR